MKVFQYLRVSSDLQKEGLKSQRLACRQFAQRNKIRIVEEFVDEESSFNIRPNFETMLSRLGEVDGILSFDLDRITRDPYEFAKILNLFQDLDKKIFQVTGELNLEKEEDVLLARIKVDVARYERDKMIRRVKSGIARKKEETGIWGRPRAKISKTRFKKYIDGNVLITSKASLSKIFGVSKPTLIQWMKDNGFEYLIKDEPEHFKELRIET